MGRDDLIMRHDSKRWNKKDKSSAFDELIQKIEELSTRIDHLQALTAEGQLLSGGSRHNCGQPPIDCVHIFSDNASTDGTVRRLRDVAKVNSGVKVLIMGRVAL